MDLWVVAAAAGAGYVVRHCKSLVKGKQGFSYSSCSSPSIRTTGSSIMAREVKDRDSCPCSLEHCDKECETVSSDVERLSFSYSEGQNRVIHAECADSCTCLDAQETRVCDNDSGLSSTRETVAYGFRRKKSGLRSRRANARFLKPVNSLESCLMAQLYKEQTEAENYACASMTPPSSPTARSYPVTNGGSIIGRSACNSFSSSIRAGRERQQKGCNSGDMRIVLGVPQLPSVGSEEYRSKGKSRMKLEPGVKEKHQMQGFSQGALIFCMGLSVGLASSALNNKREIEKLSNLLKQSESLVQDLQEEIEMKDSLTVKELAVEDCEARDTQNDALGNGPSVSLQAHEKAEEESFSLIEAELEAELQRLELSIHSSGLDSGMLNQAEIDADSVPLAIKGDLNPDVLGGLCGPLPYADRDESGSSTPPSVHHAVSPRELTLRLHQVIQSRLEKRVEELEDALQNSQMKIHYMESQNVGYLREFSNRKSRHSSLKGSSLVKDESQADEPVVMDLSGESLDDEYTKVTDLDEEEENIWQSDDDDERVMLPDNSYLSNDFQTRETEDDDGEAYDEMEELLIKQIVEQARKGSPVVLNAQRALSSPDENEHSL